MPAQLRNFKYPSNSRTLNNFLQPQLGVRPYQIFPILYLYLCAMLPPLPLETQNNEIEGVRVKSPKQLEQLGLLYPNQEGRRDNNKFRETLSGPKKNCLVSAEDKQSRDANYCQIGFFLLLSSKPAPFLGFLMEKNLALFELKGSLKKSTTIIFVYDCFKT